MGGDHFATSSPMPGVGQVAMGALSNGSRFDDYGESDDDLHSENIMFPGDASHIGKYFYFDLFICVCILNMVQIVGGFWQN